MCITWGMARRLPPPRGLPTREVEKCVCGDDRDVKNKIIGKKSPGMALLFLSRPVKREQILRGERGASGPWGQGGQQSCGWVSGEGISQAVLGRRLLLRAGIFYYYFLMPSLLRVIGTIVHDTDFFLKVLKM